MLEVVNGGETATINMIGDYTSASSTLGADSGGHAKITDPPVVEAAAGQYAGDNRRRHCA